MGKIIRDQSALAEVKNISLVQARNDSLPALKADIVEFWVHNTGTVIDPDKAGKVFERFYQSETGKKKGGTGLGLAISKMLVEVMGGAIRVQNDEQHGTKFIFSIPAKTQS